VSTTPPTSDFPAKRSELRTLCAAGVALVFLVGLLGGFILGREWHQSGGAVSTATPAMTTGADIPLPPELVRLASTWKCMCGSCKDRLLDCVCNQPRGALEVKRFMLDLSKAGTPLETIRQKVTERFGAGVTGQAQLP